MFAFEFECNQQFRFSVQTMDEETAHNLISHKGQKVQNYPLKRKTIAIQYTEIYGKIAAKRKFGTDQNRI